MPFASSPVGFVTPALTLVICVASLEVSVCLSIQVRWQYLLPFGEEKSFLRIANESLLADVIVYCCVTSQPKTKSSKQKLLLSLAVLGLVGTAEPLGHLFSTALAGASLQRAGSSSWTSCRETGFPRVERSQRQVEAVSLLRLDPEIAQSQPRCSVT